MCESALMTGNSNGMVTPLWLVPTVRRRTAAAPNGGEWRHDHDARRLRRPRLADERIGGEPVDPRVGGGRPVRGAAAGGPSRDAEARAACARSGPRPRAGLAVSAHWFINASAESRLPSPKTIYDFFG